MARPKQIDDEQLLDALRETFLELGPAASTQELAQRAGVSEGTLFKRFGTKKKIFTDAMRLPPMEDRAWFVGMLDRAGEGSFEEHLVDLATGMRAFFDEVIPLLHVITANGKLTPGELQCLFGPDEEPPPVHTMRRFEQFFSREMDLGRIKRTDANSLASFFVGAVVHDFHMRMHYPNHDFGDGVEKCRRIARTLAELTAVDAHVVPKTTRLRASH